MIIYKITNLINGKGYIGQTICNLDDRWKRHKKFSNFSRNNNSESISHAIKKYGKENFTIEEIGGANSLSELNYQEWLLIHRYNTLHPNGYNLVEGGSKGKVSEISKKLMSESTNKFYQKKENRAKFGKKVVNIETGKIYGSAMECSKELGLKYGTLKAKLQGRNFNNTTLRYVGQEDVQKIYVKKKDFKKKKGRGVINSKTGETWLSVKQCAIDNNFKNTTYLYDRLRGRIAHTKETQYFKYMEVK